MLFRIIIIMVSSFVIVECAIPGTFFWKPRLALVMVVPTTVPPKISQPTKANIANGTVVIIDGFKTALCVAALGDALTTINQFPQLNPSSAYFYTTAYRWALRYLSLLPDWMSGKTGHYAHTHRVWKKRFHYMDAFVPKWLRPVLPFIKKSEWDREEKEYRGYRKYSEQFFRHLYEYPGVNFTNYKSQEGDPSKTDKDSTSSMSCFNC